MTMKIQLLNKNNISVYRSLIPAVEIRETLDNNGRIVGASSDEGEPAGVMTVRRETVLEGKSSILFIDYYFVAEKFRNQGIFSQMIDKTEKAAANLKCDGILLQLIYPEMEDSLGTITSLGFERREDGNKIYRFSPEILSDSSIRKLKPGPLEKRVKSLEELSSKEKRGFFESFGQNMPEDLGPASVNGRLLEDLSFVYIHEKQICGFVLCSCERQGECYLASMYFKPEHRRYAAVLIKRLLEAMDQNDGYEKVMFAAVNEKSEKLAEHILSGVNGTIERQVVRNYYKPIKKGDNHE